MTRTRVIRAFYQTLKSYRVGSWFKIVAILEVNKNDTVHSMSSTKTIKKAIKVIMGEWVCVKVIILHLSIFSDKIKILNLLEK